MSSDCVRSLVHNLSESMNINAVELTQEDFDVKTLSTAIMKTSQLSEHLSNLATNINTLDREIKEQVSQNHENLLHQAINIETLEEMLDMVQTRITSLKSTSERLRNKIDIPFNELNLRVVQLSRLQSACDTLRRIKGILHHSQKLRVHMQAGVKDITKSAQCLNELDFLLKNFDSTGIEIIENDVLFAHKSRREIEELSHVILEKGMTHQDQNQIGTSLQVFYSLGILDKKLSECLKLNEKKFSKKSMDLLDSTNLTLQSTSSSGNLQSSASVGFMSGSSQFPGRSTMPNVGQMGQFRAQLWTNVEKLMDFLYDSCSQIYQLQIILEKKKDIATNVHYLEEINFTEISKNKMYLLENGQVRYHDSIYACTEMSEFKKTAEFMYEQWRLLTQALALSLQTRCNQSNYIKQTFQNEYPKLLKLVNELWSRLLQLNPLVDKYRYQTDKKSYLNSYEMLRKCFIDLENSFLTKSLTQLFDPINLIFSNTEKINRADLEAYIKGVQTQLQNLQYDTFSSEQSGLNSVQQFKKKISITSYSSSFSDKIIANISKSIQLYSNKAEQFMTSLISELNQSVNSNQGANIGGIKTIFSFSTGVPYQIQMKNLDYVNVTHDLMEQLNKLFSVEKLDPKFVDKLKNSVKSLQVFEENSLRPFVQSACDCVQAILVTMHQEDLNQPQTCSLYVKELQQVMQRVSRDYLQMYNCKDVLNVYMNQISVRCIDLFVRNASLLRPLNDQSRLRLKNDSEQLETIIQTLLTPKLTDLGVNYKLLKGFRNLLEQSPPGSDNVEDYSDVLAQGLPFHVLLHYLFSFAPSDLKSPHQSLGDWSLQKYSDWLDKHPNEKERLLVIKTCLDSYVNSVKQRKEKTFAQIYPLMFRLLEKGLQSVIPS